MRKSEQEGYGIWTYRLIRSTGDLRPSGPPPGPEESMTPFPPVIRMTSRALVKKFCRYRRATSDGREEEGKRAGE